MDCFHLGLLHPGAWEGQGKLDQIGREGEKKSAVHDYRCKMAVCWTEFTLGLGFRKL